MAWPAVAVSAAARTAGHGMPCPYERGRPAATAGGPVGAEGDFAVRPGPPSLSERVALRATANGPVLPPRQSAIRNPKSAILVSAVLCGVYAVGGIIRPRNSVSRVFRRFSGHGESALNVSVINVCLPL